MTKYKIGSIHGRFQPLHNGHLEYIIEAKKRCDFLWIGITQYNIKSLYKSPTNPHRQYPTSNPLTYFERVEMINKTLINKGINHAEFGTVPFPLGDSDSLNDFIPINIPIFTTICDSWNRYKVNLLEEKGYKVIVLLERDKDIIRGSEIRENIIQNIDSWKEQVPKETIDIINKYNITERLKNLCILNSK